MDTADHRHCKECGRVCPSDREVCSDACRVARRSRMSSRRQTVYFFYAMIAVLVVLFVLSYVHL